MDENRSSISASDLYGLLGTSKAPTVVDVRRGPAFDADHRMVAGALRRDPADVNAWRRECPQGREVVVYCVHGREVSQEVAAALRALGIDARYLQGGIEAWLERGLPTRRKVCQTAMWITRERPKVDRIACPWLVRRFIDPEATFLYVPADRVLAVAGETGAIAYDIPGAEPFAHDGERCSFDGFLKAFELSDPPLDRLALIVRGADTGHLELTAESEGLLAVSRGLSAYHANDDHAMLEHGMVIYDALYAWCRLQQGNR